MKIFNIIIILSISDTELFHQIQSTKQIEIPASQILETIKIKIKNKNYKAVLPQIMNFGQIQIPNNIRIFKNDEYEYYSEFEKLFEYYLWEIFE